MSDAKRFEGMTAVVTGGASGIGLGVAKRIAAEGGRVTIWDQDPARLKAAVAEVLPYEKKNPYPLGSVTHEAGGARMGDDPKISMLDKWNRCHDIKNLLVVDAACFTSHPEKSVTLTIMALSWRASEHLLDEAGKGNL